MEARSRHVPLYVDAVSYVSVSSATNYALPLTNISDLTLPYFLEKTFCRLALRLHVSLSSNTCLNLIDDPLQSSSTH